MIKPKTFLVFPNPWGIAPNSITIDGTGRASGHFPTDPVEDGSNRKWVGVRLDQQRTKLTADPKDYKDGSRSIPQTTVYSFLGLSGEEVTAAKLAKQSPVKIPATRYYRQAIATGQLVAANEETALACGARKYEKPADALARFEKDAVDAYNKIHGKGQFAKLAKVRARDEADEAPAKPKTGAGKG
jgi:hypothetical protein